jgi:uncharacterized phiE125 gp8 family phage protein
MKRALVVPPVLSPAALGELKQWLAISVPGDDAALTALLRAALETCEAFTGLMPLGAECEEVLPARATWQALATRPVLAVTGVEGIPAEGRGSRWRRWTMRSSWTPTAARWCGCCARARLGAWR